jgi:peptidoglycan-N-acetylglucosamine deacetylase
MKVSTRLMSGGVRVAGLTAIVAVFVGAGLSLGLTHGPGALKPHRYDASSPPRAKLIYRGSPARRWVALTFDAGSDRGYAGRILDYLHKSGLRATFGMTGSWANANRDLLKTMARYGEQIVNHSYDHRSFTGFSTRTEPLSWNERAVEINRLEGVVRAITGRSTKPYFRPPYGDYDQSLLREAQYLGYRYVLTWTFDSLGWKGIPKKQIEMRCAQLVRPGAIILMHVGSQSKDGLALPQIVRALRSSKYRIVTVDQLVTGKL